MAGVFIVGAAKYIELPEKVEAGEAHDVVQDNRFDTYLQLEREAKLRDEVRQETLNEILQQQVTQAPANVAAQGVAVTRRTDDLRPPQEETWIEEDEDGCWRCQAQHYDDCWEDDEDGDNLWRWIPCPETS